MFSIYQIESDSKILYVTVDDISYVVVTCVNRNYAESNMNHFCCTQPIRSTHKVRKRLRIVQKVTHTHTHVVVLLNTYLTERGLLRRIQAFSTTHVGVLFFHTAV